MSVSGEEETERSDSLERDASTDPTCPEGFELVTVFFQEGPLGVTLRRRVEEGVVYVAEIVPDSQAVGLDIAVGDELWGVATSIIGTTPLDKEAWNGLIQFIKLSPRPLAMIWKRAIDHAQLASNATVDIEQAASIVPEEQSVLPAASPLENENASPSEAERTASVDDSSPEIHDQTEENALSGPSESKEMEKTPEDVEQSESYQDFYIKLMQDISTRIFFKEREKEKTSFIGNLFGRGNQNQSQPLKVYDLMKPGRQLQLAGEFLIFPNKTTTTFTLSKKYLLVCNDILIITNQSSTGVIEVEEEIDLRVCRVRKYLVNRRATDFSNYPNFNPDDFEKAFELFWPNGPLILLCSSTFECDLWSSSIFTAICEKINFNGESFGWKHQYLLGTIHSAVVLRDENLLRDLLVGVNSGSLDASLLEEHDGDGYTPLHYASILKYYNIIKIILSANVNPNLPDSKGLTPLHWAALQLDDTALSILAPSSYDIDIRDFDDQTSLFLSCIFGRLKNGSRDNDCLVKCVECLLSRHADVHCTDSNGNNLLHHMASRWLYSPVKTLIKYHADIFSIDYLNGSTALHFALGGTPLPLLTSHFESGSKPKQFDIKDTLSDRKDGLETLKTLLNLGGHPNICNFHGKAPIHVLAEQAESVWGDSLVEVVKLMVSFGARFDESPLSQSIKSRVNSVILDKALEFRANLPIVDASALNLSSLECAKHLISSPAADKNTPSCPLCSVNFTLFRRQHHCRLCGVLCCDDCSKKRVILDSNQVRCCDSCYNRAHYVSEQRQLLLNNNPLATSPSTNSSMLSASSNSAQSTNSKQELFGSNYNKIDPSNQRASSTSSSSASSNANRTMSVMSEARDRMIERGEKLNKLADKSADLSNSASEFAKLAKQLNEQQKSRWF